MAICRSDGWPTDVQPSGDTMPDLPGEKLVIRLWETMAEKGIGALLRPWQMRREGRASTDVQRDEILVLAQAERDAEEIRTGRVHLGRDGVLRPLLPAASEDQGVGTLRAPGAEAAPALQRADYETVVRAVADGQLADALRNEVNVAKALLSAESQLGSDTQEPPERTIDPDWLQWWRDSAAAVSSEELQHLWGQVLAGEIKAPGTYSLRTVEFLRNVSQEEAQKISLFARFAVEGIIARTDDTLLHREGLTLNLLLEMQDLGIITGVGAIGLNMSWRTAVTGTFRRGLYSNGKVLVVSHQDAGKQIVVPAYLMTRLGRELAELGVHEPHLGYLQRLGEGIKSEGFAVSLADYTVISKGEVRTHNVRVL